jgi:thiol-disulfide isomerase/thioredoxin
MDFSTQNLMSNKYVIIAVLSLLFIVIGFFIYKSYVGSSPTMTDDIYDDGSDVSDSSDAELMFFHVDWCPHCKTALPEWEKIKKEYNNKKINGHRILFLEYNCTEETEETTKKIETYKIEGYPTIKLKIDGRVIEFDAKVNKENMEQFLSTVLA